MLDFDDLKCTLPTGSTFRSIIENHQIYVDKTKFIKTLASDLQAILLTRPRHFGKSTIVSLLEELYTHGVKPYIDENGCKYESLFKGLVIEKLWQDEKNYKVIHFDFSERFNDGNLDYSLLNAYGLTEHKSNAATLAVLHFIMSLKRRVMQYINKFGIILDIDYKRADPQTLFDALIKTIGLGNNVLLIDEYDYPLVHIPSTLNSEESKYYLLSITEVIKSFYANLKANNSYFRKIFITGITRYKDASIFTAGNTIKDISAMSEYGAIVGFTREEIKKFFKEHLQYKASLINNKQVDTVTLEDIDKLLDVMALKYDSYSFDAKCSTHVFSTFSVLNYFASYFADLQNFWAEGGGYPTILMRNIDKIEKVLSGMIFDENQIYE